MEILESCGARQKDFLLERYLYSTDKAIVFNGKITRFFLRSPKLYIHTLNGLTFLEFPFDLVHIESENSKRR